MAGFTADGISPEDHYGPSRFILVIPSIGEIPVATIAERPAPTRDIVASDGTSRTQGESDPQSVDFTVPEGNDAVRVALINRWLAAKGQVQPGYKEDAQLIVQTVGGTRLQTETLEGAWIQNYVRASLDKTTGAPAEELRGTFTLKYDDIDIQFG